MERTWTIVSAVSTGLLYTQDMKLLASTLFTAVACTALSSAGTLSLAGDWRLAFDPADKRLASDPAGWTFDDTVRLPGSTAGQRKGPEMTMELRLDKETMNRLRERHPYVGPAWYQREVEIPADWEGKDIRLTLERVLWESRVWVDGKPVGAPRDSLSAPHRHDLTAALIPGKRHLLTLRIDNREIVGIGTIGHAYTEGTQTIWNGVIGKLELEALPKMRIEQATPRTLPGLAGLSVEIATRSDKARTATLKLASKVRGDDVFRPLSEVVIQVPAGESMQRIEARDLPAGLARWSEADPALHELSITLADGDGEHAITRGFGFREFTADGQRLLINGQPTFLRGNLECAIFPQTGHPDAEGPQWEKIMRVTREWGLNHLRFHSWCPPAAAFEAADRHGIYLQVELPNWTFKMGQNPPVDAFFQAEGERIFREYGHHPSFVMFSLGNELTGDYAAMDRLIEAFRPLAPGMLFTSTAFSFSPRGNSPGPADDFFISQQTSSGWVRGQGFLNSTFPSTDTDYAPGLSSIKIPLVTHEVGQYVVYPNLAELPKYETTPLRSPALEVIKHDLTGKGLLADAAAFTRDSGKLAALLYKEDIERALRTKDLAGIQLLQLQDFPGQSTATVGLLDAFWDNKGAISPEEFRRFSSPVVPLVRMKKFVWENRETFAANIELANFGEAPLQETAFTARLLGPDGVPVAEETFHPADYPLGNGLPVGRIEVPLTHIATATRLELSVNSADGRASNSWPVWVYPVEQATPAPVVHRAANDALFADLAAGKSVLFLPLANTVKKPLPARFIPVFWSPLHFPNQPGTLGATIDAGHPLWNHFPTETHTNWQWWELTAHSIAVDLTGLDPAIAKPFRFIDKFDRNALPAAIFEAKVGPGKLLVCTLDATGEPAKRIVARQLLRALKSRAAAADFAPEGRLTPDDLRGLFRPAGITATASSSHRDYPAAAALDGDPATIWHSDWESGAAGQPITYTLDMQEPALIAGLQLANRRDNPNGRIKDFRCEISVDGKRWLAYGKPGRLPNHDQATDHRFDQPVKARFIRILADSSHGPGRHASLAEIQIIPAPADDVRDLGIIPGFND